MSRHFMLSSKWKVLSLILLVVSAAIFIGSVQFNVDFRCLHHSAHLKGFDLSNDNLTDELGLSGLIVSLLMLAFCAERIEDEYVRNIRLRCWQWAVMANYVLLLLSIWLVYGTAFIGILYYNMLTTLLLFLILFYGRIYLIPLMSKKPAL
jgi:hypothetical protein